MQYETNDVGGRVVAVVDAADVDILFTPDEESLPSFILWRGLMFFLGGKDYTHTGPVSASYWNGNSVIRVTRSAHCRRPPAK